MKKKLKFLNSHLLTCKHQQQFFIKKKRKYKKKCDFKLFGDKIVVLFLHDGNFKSTTTITFKGIVWNYYLFIYSDNSWSK